jgi:RNA polymerase sigma factor (sigma-70 family)
MRDLAAAEEVVQDSFVALYSAWPRLQDSEKALSYLRQSVVRRSRTVLQHGGQAGRPTPNLSVREHATPDTLELSAVISALRALPMRQREALVLRFYGNLSQAQIAAAMSISIAAVRFHTAAAMRSLRATLDTER